MKDKRPHAKRIIDCLKTDYCINVATLSFIPLGADLDASVYKAQAYDRSSYFVKLKRNHHDIGAVIQLVLHDAGIPQIIAPVKTKGDKPTHYIDDYTLTVYPFIEGKDGFSRDPTDEQWITIGKALRRVHACALPPSIKDQIRHESYSPQWREAVRSIYTHIDAEPKVADDIAAQLLAFMKEQRNTIQRLVDRAEQLANKIQLESPEYVLCHSDIHAGNVLLANDGALYIVDWDHPIMAPKERDLMFIGGGVGNVWNDQREAALFYQGYGNTEINREILAYYRHERIVEDIALYSQQLLLTSDGGEDRAVMYKHFVGMFEPHGVVNIAFKTDRPVLC